VIGGGHVGYDVQFMNPLLFGAEIGYKYLGRSTYKLNSDGSEMDYVLNGNGQYVGITGTAAFAEQVKLNQQAIDLLVTGRLYVWGDASIVAKAGAAYVQSTYQNNYSGIPDFPGVNAPSIAYSSKKSIWRVRPEVSLGFGYTFHDNLDLRLTYTYINGTDGNNLGVTRYFPSSYGDSAPGTFAYNALSVGLNYYFG
jgi:hypothetical protein